MAGSDAPSPRVTTLAERKRNEATRRKLAADAAVRELRRYASEHGGRYVIFGSYAEGTLRFDSDLDVLIDFPAGQTTDAWLFAEDVCARHQVPLDIHDARTTTAAFAERVVSRGLILS
ncbi:nucleotidyltransferase family protein [Lutibaculum baratangense]|uniref:nucleotidyltransferase family protein n=1 Tax=Lutibaculum baratangense TaxID=1358440 RepID=UPI0005913E48|nr:nucleotidyltransferase domain-containing protein [Lutibaculum baratangense]